MPTHVPGQSLCYLRQTLPISPRLSLSVSLLISFFSAHERTRRRLRAQCRSLCYLYCPGSHVRSWNSEFLLLTTARGCFYQSGPYNNDNGTIQGFSQLVRHKCRINPNLACDSRQPGMGSYLQDILQLGRGWTPCAPVSGDCRPMNTPCASVSGDCRPLNTELFLLHTFENSGFGFDICHPTSPNAIQIHITSNFVPDYTPQTVTNNSSQKTFRIQTLKFKLFFFAEMISLSTPKHV